MKHRKFITPLVVAAAMVGAFLVPATSATAEVAVAPGTDVVVPFGATGWSYYRGVAAPPSNWKTSPQRGATGTAPLGFGVNTGTLGTTLNNTFTVKPLASYFQRVFSLKTVPAEGVNLTTWADDGIIVYANGKEVLRKNLPSGTITDKSYATAAPQTADAKAAKVTAKIPASVLAAGPNLLSVQVQSNWRATHNVTFDAQLTTSTPAPTPTATTAPSPSPSPAPSPSTSPSPAPAPDSGWGTPTWQDNFTYIDPATNKPAIDPTKWNVRDRSDLGLLFDAAVPSRDQVSVDGQGIAHLRGDWLSTPVIRPSTQTGPRELWHKTAYMDQRSLDPGNMSYSQRWGRWEIRAKVPTGPKTLGALAAFWLRNSNSGEIDIMEAWGYNEAAAPGGQRIDTATTTVHTQTSGAGNEKYIWHHADYGAATPVWDGFHTYAFELTPSYAAIYFDGARLATATPSTYPNLWNEKYFGSPLHVRLNLHVGPSATYWGLPDPNHKDWTKPLDYQVDYVKIWKYDPQ